MKCSLCIAGFSIDLLDRDYNYETDVSDHDYDYVICPHLPHKERWIPEGSKSILIINLPWTHMPYCPHTVNEITLINLKRMHRINYLPRLLRALHIYNVNIHHMPFLPSGLLYMTLNQLPLKELILSKIEINSLNVYNCPFLKRIIPSPATCWINVINCPKVEEITNHSPWDLYIENCPLMENNST